MENDASFDMDAPTCPSYHITREQLKSTDFLSFVQRVFREQPDLPAFKIVPPVDWKPTQRRPNLDELTIQTPIKQLVRAGPSGCCARWAPRSTLGPQPTRPHVYRRLARQGLTDASWWKTRCALRLPRCELSCVHGRLQARTCAVRLNSSVMTIEALMLWPRQRDAGSQLRRSGTCTMLASVQIAL